MNLFNWTMDQWKAAGRHIVTAVGAVVGTLVFLRVIPQSSGETIVQNLKVIFDSVSSIITATGSIIVALAPIWAMLKASASASPERQAEATVRNLEQGRPINGKRDQLIAAIAEQPIVKEVKLTDKALAESIPSDKVKA